MAKKDKKTVEAEGSNGKVTVAQLAETLGTDARTLRMFIRSLGFKAPEIKQEGFGPRAKYEWDVNSDELKKIIKAWEEKGTAKAE